MENTRKKKLRTFTMADDSHEKIKAAAKADNRTLSNFIETALLRYIDSLKKEE